MQVHVINGGGVRTLGEKLDVIVAKLERGRLGDDRADLAVAIDDTHAFYTRSECAGDGRGGRNKSRQD